MRCRGSVARREPASTRNRSGRRSASSSALIERMRAAASSSASGTPSSRMQSSAMARRLPSSRAKSAWAAVARATNSCTAGTAARSANGWSASLGTGNGGTDHTSSAAMPSGSRLVARTCTCGHHCSTRSTSSLAVSITCSQLSSTRRRRRGASTSTIESASERCGRCCTSSAAATAAVTAPSSRTGPSSTRRTPSANVGATVFANRRARRVLPTPPGPNRVRMRPVASSRSTSSRSSSRPTRGVVSAGRSRRGVDASAGARPAPHLAPRNARSSRSSRIAASSSRRSADGSRPRSSRSVVRKSCATRSASACRPDR